MNTGYNHSCYHGCWVLMLVFKFKVLPEDLTPATVVFTTVAWGYSPLLLKGFHPCYWQFSSPSVCSFQMICKFLLQNVHWECGLRMFQFLRIQIQLGVLAPVAWGYLSCFEFQPLILVTGLKFFKVSDILLN